MRLIYILNSVYLILEICVLFTVVNSLPSDFKIVWQQAGYFVWVDVILVIAHLVITLYAVLRLFFIPKSLYFTLLSYLPILLFFERGPLTLIGIFLMMLGLYMKFKSWNIKKSIKQWV